MTEQLFDFSTMERISNVDSVDVIQVIRVCSLKGKGVEGSPMRRVTEYWSMKGACLARRDEWDESHSYVKPG